MTLQVKFDIQTRESCIKTLLQGFKTRSATKSENIESLFNTFHLQIGYMSEDVKTAYKELKIHYYLDNFKELTDDLESFEKGDLVVLADANDAEKEVKKAVIGAYNE